MLALFEHGGEICHRLLHLLALNAQLVEFRLRGLPELALALEFLLLFGVESHHVFEFGVEIGYLTASLV